MFSSAEDCPCRSVCNLDCGSGGAAVTFWPCDPVVIIQQASNAAKHVARSRLLGARPDIASINIDLCFTLQLCMPDNDDAQSGRFLFPDVFSVLPRVQSPGRYDPLATCYPPRFFDLAMRLGRLVGDSGFVDCRLFAVGPATKRKALICDGFAFCRQAPCFAFCTAIDASKELGPAHQTHCSENGSKWITER